MADGSNFADEVCEHVRNAKEKLRTHGLIDAEGEALE